MNLNILVEFSAKNKGIEGQKALDMIEEDFKSHDLFLVDWQRKDQKIRVYSKASEIRNALDTRRWTKYQIAVIASVIIPQNDEDAN